MVVTPVAAPYLIRFVICCVDGYEWIVRQHGRNVMVSIMIIIYILFANIFYKFEFDIGVQSAYLATVVMGYCYCINSLYTIVKGIIQRIRIRCRC